MENIEKLKPDFEQHLMAQGFICNVEIQNRTPSSWSAVIGGACKFTYQDDKGKEIGNYTYYHSDLNVGTGASLYFQSNQPNSCVKRVDVLVYVASPLLSSNQTFPATDSCDQAHCMKNPSWIIEPQQNQLRSELKKGNSVGFVLTQK